MRTPERVREIETESGRLTLATWGEGDAEIVLLHDGLGSIAQWREVPEALAGSTGRTVAAYDRAGHGRSTPTPSSGWPIDWLHREAVVLDEVLATVAAPRPFVVGHSDGGSIALLQAASGETEVRGVAALAPHSYVEDVCVEAIAAMRVAPERIVEGLARYHAEPEALFNAWSGVWTNPEFGLWDVRTDLGAIEVPTLVVQGTEDEYATDEQATESTGAIGENATCVLLDNLGHLLPHQDPDGIVALLSDAIAHAFA